ncbi:MAG: hypothetical protein AAGG38_09215 [Planctomycetota bacterium]
MSYNSTAPQWLLDAAGLMPDPYKFEYLSHKRQVREAIRDRVLARTYDHTIHVAANGDDSTGDGSIGSPYQTVARANQVAATNNGAGDTTMVKLRNGDVFRERRTTGNGLLELYDNDGLATYGNVGKPAMINGFDLTYSSGWTLVSGTHYVRTEASTPLSLRRQGHSWRWKPAYKASATDDSLIDFAVGLGAIGWWHYDSAADELHVDLGVDPNTIDIEAATATGSAGNGVYCYGGSHIDGVVIDGFTGAAANHAHCITTRAPEDTETYIHKVSCAYAGSTHIVARESSWANQGVLLWETCEAGLTVANNSTVFNDYTNNTGQTDIFTIFHRCVAKFGAQPSHEWLSENRPKSISTGFFGHTASGGAIGYVLIDECLNEDVPFGCVQLALWTNVGFTNIDGTDPDNWIDFPVHIYGCNHGKLRSAGTTHYSYEHVSAARTNHLAINNFFQADADATFAAEGFSSTGIGGSAAQNIIDVDLSNITDNYTNAGLFNPPGAAGRVAFFGNHYRMRDGENYGVELRPIFFDRDKFSSSTRSSDGVAKANIFEYLSERAPTNVWIALNNDAELMIGNAYYGCSETLTTDGKGYSSDPQLYEPDTPTPFGAAMLEAPTVTAEVNPMEYDFFERRRPTAKSRGPVEASPLIPDVLDAIKNGELEGVDFRGVLKPALINDDGTLKAGIQNAVSYLAS